MHGSLSSFRCSYCGLLCACNLTRFCNYTRVVFSLCASKTKNLTFIFVCFCSFYFIFLPSPPPPPPRPFMFHRSSHHHHLLSPRRQQALLLLLQQLLQTHNSNYTMIQEESPKVFLNILPLKQSQLYTQNQSEMLSL